MRQLAAVGLVAFVAAVASPGVASAHTAPLNPYRWVNPPPDVKAANTAAKITNQAPSGCDTAVAATADRVETTNVWTQDGQAVVTLPTAPLPHRNRDSISVVITPVDAAALGALPRGLIADGNALRVTVKDGDTELPPLNPSATLIMFVPHQTGLALFSSDGKAWSNVAARSLAERDSEVVYSRAGYYLMVADHPLTGGSSAGLSTGTIVALVVIPPVALVALLVLARRRRGRTAESSVARRATTNPEAL
jgi:hypothetical protein